jgi:hypothetical protein
MKISSKEQYVPLSWLAVKEAQNIPLINSDTFGAIVVLPICVVEGWVLTCGSLGAGQAALSCG